MTKPKKSASKKAGSRSKRSRGAQTLAAASAAAAPPAPPPPENEEIDTYIFSRHPLNKYIDAAITWPTFRDGKNKLFRFHQVGLPPPAQKTEIELFAARLDKYLLGLGYAGTEGARYYIRAAVGKDSDPMRVLLAAVTENYKP